VFRSRTFAALMLAAVAAYGTARSRKRRHGGQDIDRPIGVPDRHHGRGRAADARRSAGLPGDGQSPGRYKRQENRADDPRRTPARRKSARRTPKGSSGEDKVFLLFGYTGRNTSEAALPIIGAANIPFFGAATGGESIHGAFNKNVFNVRASYTLETQALVNHLVATGQTKIGMIYQQGRSERRAT